MGRPLPQCCDSGSTWRNGPGCRSGSVGRGSSSTGKRSLKGLSEQGGVTSLWCLNPGSEVTTLRVRLPAPGGRQDSTVPSFSSAVSCRPDPRGAFTLLWSKHGPEEGPCPIPLFWPLIYRDPPTEHKNIYDGRGGGLVDPRQPLSPGVTVGVTCSAA